MNNNLTEENFRSLFNSLTDEQKNSLKYAFLFGPKKFAIEFYTVDRKILHYEERWESFIKLRRFGGNSKDDFYTPFGFNFTEPLPKSCDSWETIGIFCCGVDYVAIVTELMNLDVLVDDDKTSDDYLLEYVIYNNEKLYAGTAEFEDLLRTVDLDRVFPWPQIVDNMWLSYTSFYNGNKYFNEWNCEDPDNYNK